MLDIVNHQGNVGVGWVVDDIAVGAHDERLICADIVIYFDVCGIPRVLLAADRIAEAFKHVPVLIIVKFIAVSPEIE